MEIVVNKEKRQQIVNEIYNEYLSLIMENANQGRKTTNFTVESEFAEEVIELLKRNIKNMLKYVYTNSYVDDLGISMHAVRFILE